MTHRNNDNKLNAAMEMLIENGFESFVDVLRIPLNEAMKIERDRDVCQRYFHSQGNRCHGEDVRAGYQQYAGLASSQIAG